jgi:hypothetical protein
VIQENKEECHHTTQDTTTIPEEEEAQEVDLIHLEIRREEDTREEVT